MEKIDIKMFANKEPDEQIAILVINLNRIIDHLNAHGPLLMKVDVTAGTGSPATVNMNTPVEEWPKNGDEYYFLREDGEIVESCWRLNNFLHKNRRNFLGIYPTESEALAARERVIKALKG